MDQIALEDIMINVINSCLLHLLPRVTPSCESDAS